MRRLSPRYSLRFRLSAPARKPRRIKSLRLISKSFSASNCSVTCAKAVFKWNLSERIKRNSEDWEFDEGKESGMNFTFDCVKSFVETNTFSDFSAKYGLDSEIVASLCESFAAHIDLPKEKSM